MSAMVNGEKDHIHQVLRQVEVINAIQSKKIVWNHGHGKAPLNYLAYIEMY